MSKDMRGEGGQLAQPGWLAKANLPQLLHALEHEPRPYLPLRDVGFSHLTPIMAVDDV
jgi:hypothetical protein